MKIQERITTLTEEVKDDNMTSLWRVCRGIVENVSQHNKQIIAQMRDYDTHDKEHSEKVLEIIEDILGQNMEKLTVYELLLLYMSAYLHDSAMALPDCRAFICSETTVKEGWRASFSAVRVSSSEEYSRLRFFQEVS